MRRKRPRSAKVLLFLSAVVAVGSTLVLRGHLVRLEARAHAAGPGAPTVVATEDLPRGTELEPELLSTREVPTSFRPPGALARVEDAVGQTLSAAVLAGEPVTTARLSGPGGPVGALVPVGLRAAPVVVPLAPGLVAAGDRVDVLATFAAGQPHTETVAPAAEVLSVLRDAAAFDGMATVVLLVSPETAERLAYAQSFAELSVTVASGAEM